VIDRPLEQARGVPVAALRAPRPLLVDLYDAAVAGAAPGPLTTAALRELDPGRDQRVSILAFGKAAHTMATAAMAALQLARRDVTGGVIVAPEALPTRYGALASVAGDHPVPGRRSFAAAQRIGEVAAGLRGDDAALVLISGGATSLIGAPLRGIAESDLVQLYELLLASGLDIRAMNAVRKRFARWGAGRLALALAPARTLALVVSDVQGDDPADIASGPCSPDSATAQDVVDILRRAGLHERIAPTMREHLAGVIRGAIPETPRATHPAFAHVATRVIGSNRLSTEAAARRAAQLGLDVVDHGSVLEGDAAECGASLAQAVVERRRAGWHGCMIWGGETTVTLGAAGDGTPPRGGRCQELALAAARVLADAGEHARGVTLLAAGTDGRDGPTDAAGAFADSATWEAIRAAGIAPEAALARHDSYAALDAVGALHRRGHTGTNVRDVVIAVVE
jgi:hydroxypyruvate reductase